MDVLKRFLSSRKAMVMLAGVVAWAVGRAGFNVDPNDLLAPLGLAATWIGAEAVVDTARAKEQAAVANAISTEANKPENRAAAQAWMADYIAKGKKKK